MTNKAPWHVTVFTLFPEMFPGPLGHSIFQTAREKKLWDMKTVQLRDYAGNKHNTVDAAAFGGGPGLVIRPDVVDKALTDHCNGVHKPNKLLYLSPRGKPFCNERAKELANAKKVAMLCGRYEGVDQRVLDHWDFEEVSLGDFVLAGGEVAALAMIEASLRFVPGVVGTFDSVEDDSFSNGLLEAPHFTRPQRWKDIGVPEVLTSGHHENVRKWRLEQSEKITQERRPDLWEKYLDKRS